MKQVIFYRRVSTDEQGTAGNGLEAQFNACKKFAESKGYEVLEDFQEVASGKLGLSDRPVLNAAIALANKTKAMLIVSKLDRLSRHAAFVLNLMDTKVNFCVVELGENVSPFMIHIHAVVAEQERELISKRTKDALAVLKEKGVKLGNKTNLTEAQSKGNMVVAGKADEFAEKMRPSITRMMNMGMTLKQIADEFNTNGTKTYTGNGKWSAKSICMLRARWK